MDQKKTGLLIKELRREKDLTQEQLSEILGVTNRSVSRWENGTNMPGIDLMIEMADFFAISIEELLDGERKEDMTDKKTAEVLIKAAEYSNEGQIAYSRKQRRIFIIALAAYGVFMVLDLQGLTEGIYGNIADAALGIVLGALVAGVLLTGRHMGKIRAFKQRILRRNK